MTLSLPILGVAGPSEDSPVRERSSAARPFPAGRQRHERPCSSSGPNASTQARRPAAWRSPRSTTVFRQSSSLFKSIRVRMGASLMSMCTETMQWISGFDSLRAADPGLALEAIKDRASYLFWKWIEACAKGSATPLRKCATTAFQNDITPSPVLRNLAVGGVDLTACRVAREPTGFDHLEVVIHWSGSARPKEESFPQEHLLRLIRKTGVKTKPSFASLVCQACGAPLSASDSDECDHCHARVADGEQSWVLDGVLEGVMPDSPSAQEEWI